MGVLRRKVTKPPAEGAHREKGPAESPATAEDSPEDPALEKPAGPHSGVRDQASQDSRLSADIFESLLN